MNVSIVEFPETKVAMISHRGSPEREHDTVAKLVQWKLQNKLLDQTRFRSYGLHYIPKQSVSPAEHRVDFCLSIDDKVGVNDFGIVEGKIPACRCALATDIGSRLNNQAIKHLMQVWLPESGETLSDLPTIFHYVNVGPNVTDKEAITDVYLPLL